MASPPGVDPFRLWAGWGLAFTPEGDGGTSRGSAEKRGVRSEGRCNPSGMLTVRRMPAKGNLCQGSNGSHGESALDPQSPISERRTNAWIGKALRLEGRVISHEDLTIDGDIEGSIEVGGDNLTILPGASVKADLAAKTITISGSVTVTSRRTRQSTSVRPDQ